MEVLVSRILRIEGPWEPGSHVRKLLVTKELCMKINAFKFGSNTMENSTSMAATITGGGWVTLPQPDGPPKTQGINLNFLVRDTGQNLEDQYFSLNPNSKPIQGSEASNHNGESMAQRNGPMIRAISGTAPGEAFAIKEKLTGKEVNLLIDNTTNRINWVQLPLEEAAIVGDDVAVAI